MEIWEAKPSFLRSGWSLIDCDIHNELPALESLFPYLPDYWCDYCNESAFVGPDASDYPKAVPTFISMVPPTVIFSPEYSVILRLLVVDNT